MRIHAVLAPAACFLLACTGLFPEAGDWADTAATGETAETFKQTQDCEDYLDSLREADRAAWDDANDRYGEDGTCWGTDGDEATACDDACETLFAALADDNPSIPECGGSDTGITDTADTGDTSDTFDTSDTGGSDTSDTGSTTCPLDGGTWTFVPTWTIDGCGAGAEMTSLDIDVSCDRGDMQLDTLLLGVLPLSMPCTYSGRDFDCAGADTSFGLSLELIGKASAGGDTATGNVGVAIGTDCSSAGTFTAGM